MPHDEKRASAPSPAQIVERAAIAIPLDTAAHAGHLALALGEYAAAATSRDELARALSNLLARELGPTTAAWYWCEPQLDTSGHQHFQLKRAVMTHHGPVPSRAQGRTLRVSAVAAATSRHLVLRSGPANEPDQQPEHIMAIPLGMPGPVAVLVLASPAVSAETRSHRVAVLSRLLPTLALAVNRHAQVQQEPGRGTASGLLVAEYLSILSHDLRTPLHTLGGFLEMVHDGMAGPITERQDEFLGYARTGAHQLGAMLEDVLFLSRADSSPLTLRRDRVEVSSLLHGVLNAAQVEAQVKHVTVLADIPQNLPPLLGDEERLKHALARLLSHAVSRAPASSTVEIFATAANDTVTITMKDVGPAIPEQQNKHLFSYAAHKGVNRPSGGMYLGLTVARLLVELQQGHVELLRSRQGETVVAMTLPADV
jgi:K+-sensing histidine kinase KdpD